MDKSKIQSRHILFCFCISWLSLMEVASSWGWVSFKDATAEAKIRFLHLNGAEGEHLFPETIGSGCAFFDYDKDGWLDLYLVNGGDFQKEGAPNALYRNNGDGTFTDVSQKAEVEDKEGFGAGVCIGDYNGDGWEDIYVCNYGKNVLYRNNGDGSFTDVATEAEVEEIRWSSSSAFFDYDNDGNLDLYVANYVRYKRGSDGCVYKDLKVYCSPETFEPETDALYQNRGDGTFVDVSKGAGITFAGRGLGVICGDYDDDGHTDIFVANDMTPNFLYHNLGNGGFEEVGLMAGVALSEESIMGNGMGIDLADYDNDGGLDLIITNFQDQVNTLYHNDRDGFFTDVSYPSGTGVPSLPFLAWGCGLVDFDNDGWRDLFIANGHIHNNIEKFSDVGKYAQPKQLFRNQKKMFFSDMSAKSGEDLTRPQVSRGAAFGDYDNDGDMDVIVNNLHGYATLLRNDRKNDNAWLRVALLPIDLSIGAKVWVETPDFLRQMGEVHSGGSYASHSDTRLLFGVGKSETAKVWVEWKDGTISEIIETSTRKTLILIHP